MFVEIKVLNPVQPCRNLLVSVPESLMTSVWQVPPDEGKGPRQVTGGQVWEPVWASPPFLMVTRGGMSDHGLPCFSHGSVGKQPDPVDFGASLPGFTPGLDPQELCAGGQVPNFPKPQSLSSECVSTTYAQVTPAERSFGPCRAWSSPTTRSVTVGIYEPSSLHCPCLGFHVNHQPSVLPGWSPSCTNPGLPVG